MPLPSQFEAVAQLVTEDAVAESVTCGPDPGEHVQAIEKSAKAGYDYVCMHQVDPDQEGFLSFYAREIRPRVVRNGPRPSGAIAARQWAVERSPTPLNRGIADTGGGRGADAAF